MRSSVFESGRHCVPDLIAVAPSGWNETLMPEEQFTDYYELMQISPSAEFETIQRVYRMLAARFHPDNLQTGDINHFIALTEAYKVLSDPEARANYDAQYQLRFAEPVKIFELREFAAGIEGESNRRMGILCLLYNRRRTNPDDPGLSILEFETMMSFPREHLMFTIWYLREKELLRQDEKSDFQVTALGIDYVESNLPRNRILYKLIRDSERGTPRRSDSDQRLSDDEMLFRGQPA
jgi:curved DNA-binding protein CbpA